MYLYHVLFTLINIYGVDCQKKELVSCTRNFYSLRLKKSTGNLV
jgi:hypothetical protein